MMEIAYFHLELKRKKNVNKIWSIQKQGLLMDTVMQSSMSKMSRFLILYVRLRIWANNDH